MCRVYLRRILSSTSLVYMQRVQVWTLTVVSEVMSWKTPREPYSSKSYVFVMSMTSSATAIKEVIIVSVGKSFTQ